MRFTIFILVLILVSCKDSQKAPFAGSDYLPSAKQLQEGLVWKYYYHRGKTGNGPKTDIQYTKCTLVDDSLQNEVYDAGFQKIRTYDFLAKDDTWVSISEKFINYRNIDTSASNETAYSIGQNVHTHWSGGEAILVRSVDFNGSGNMSKSIQSSIRDSMIDGVKAKIIESRHLVFPIRNGVQEDSIVYRRTRTYQEALGLVKSVMQSKDYYYRLELDELMTIAEFDRRANHGMHRVGYIDTLQTIDDHTEFSPCLIPEKINDYYNDRRAEIAGGKGRLRAMLKEKLIAEKISNESGYLTYRFVVNCEGEAGWFVTEEADLDFNKKQFSASCRTHLYELLKAERDWTTLQIRGVDRDAYTYITFKLKDGEIIELLP